MTDDTQPKRTRGYLPAEERSEFGNWLLDNMREMSFEQLAKAMAERGHVHTSSYYIAMSGRSKKPGRVIRRALEEFFGSSSVSPAAPTGDQAELVAALNRMAESNEKLIDMIGRVFLTLDERAASRTSFVRDALVELRTAVERASTGTGRGGRGPQKAAAKGNHQTSGSLPPRPTEVSRGPGK